MIIREKILKTGFSGVFVAFVCLLAAGFALAPPALAGKPDGAVRTLTVLGVRNDIDDPGWKDQLIGQGMASLVLQELYKTGRYVPVETNPEIVAEAERISRNQWNGEAPAMDSGEAERLRESFQSDSVAWARAKNFKKKRSRAFAGPFSKATVTVTVEVEVFVKDGDADPVSAEGRGRARTKSSGVLFQIREDQICFDETNVGKAAAEAVRDAVDNLEFP